MVEARGGRPERCALLQRPEMRAIVFPAVVPQTLVPPKFAVCINRL